MKKLQTRYSALEAKLEVNFYSFCLSIHLSCLCVFVFLCFCIFVFLCFCIFVFLCFCVFVFLCFCVFVFLCFEFIFLFTFLNFFSSFSLFLSLNITIFNITNLIQINPFLNKNYTKHFTGITNQKTKSFSFS
jgi:predicted membrane metal-binding protein